MGLVEISKRVATVLTDKPKARDNDNMLCSLIWWQDLKDIGLNPIDMSAKELLMYYTDKRLTSSESICRARRRLQEEYPEYRGVVTRGKKKQLEEKVKAEIKRI